MRTNDIEQRDTPLKGKKKHMFYHYDANGTVILLRRNTLLKNNVLIKKNSVIKMTLRKKNQDFQDMRNRIATMHTRQPQKNEYLYNIRIKTPLCTL